jgi:hypothetical protein
MWDLLSPDSQPGIWRRTESGYDQQKLGVQATAHDKLPDDATTGDKNPFSSKLAIAVGCDKIACSLGKIPCSAKRIPCSVG